MKFRLLFCQWLIPAMATIPSLAYAQLIITDTLNGASSSYNWASLTGACLTAGNGQGSIPACVGLPYYSGKTLVGGVNGRLPDPVGQGALRLTNGDTTTGTNGNNQTGAVVSNFTFPSNEGVQVTFTTVTYGGNAYQNSAGQKSGADGISFFLMDGAVSPNVGGNGGSLGYTCSNVNATYNGVTGAYIGVGIDEYGNFSNPNDNTVSGPGAYPGRISVRGAGNVSWNWLHTNYPAYYPSSSNQQTVVQNTCKSGYLYNYSGGTIVDKNGHTIGNGNATTQSVLDYQLLAYSNLPSGTTIYNQEATNTPLRSLATPITYALTITQNGLLSLSYSVNGGATHPVITQQSITASNGALPSNFRFGFTGGTGGGSNVHEITCFKASQLTASSSSGAINVQQTARVEVGTQLYLALYHPVNSWGQLTAQQLLYNPSTDTVTINPTAAWDANCVLTGGTCTSTGSAVTAQAPSARNLLTWNGSQGAPFEWSQLTSAQQTALDLGDSTQTANRLNFLRGDRSNELTTSGTGIFRMRTGVLGDIINSSPTWVGPPAFPYQGPWKDALYPSATMPENSNAYSVFSSTNAGRMNVVYVGANDGFLHGFRAGAYDASGNFSTATYPNDGLEVLGYIPNLTLNTIHSTATNLDFSSPQYSHNAYVDATPGTGDVYYSGAWHTWLVSGLGDGGNAGGIIGNNSSTGTGAIFSLDITNPTLFSEANASSLVKGEWTAATINCVNNSSCGNSLGNTFGTPILRRLHDGNWAAIFGNGYNSSSGTAGIFIMTINSGNGAISFRFLDTGYGPSHDPSGTSSKNGIAYVTSADLDGDHVTDYVYAGDLYGNVWRFDLTDSSPSNWSTSSSPLFSTNGLPITTRLVIASALPASGPARVILDFGTGRQTPQTLNSSASYASGTQYLMGVWDWNMSGWNSRNSVQYASLSSPQTFSMNDLQAQTATNVAGGSGSISGYRTVTMSPVCWKNSQSCQTGNTQFGWKIALPSTSEQVIYNPMLAYGLFVVDTTVPSTSQPLSCSVQPATGYTMAIAADTGASPKSSFFADATNNYISANGAVISGIGLSMVGTPSIVTAMKKPYLTGQTSAGTGVATQVDPSAGGIGGRLTWTKLR